MFPLFEAVECAAHGVVANPRTPSILAGGVDANRVHNLLLHWDRCN